jgi:hypothetical protein
MKPVRLYIRCFTPFLCGCNFDLKFHSYHSILRDTKTIICRRGVQLLDSYTFLNTLLVLAVLQALAEPRNFTLGVFWLPTTARSTLLALGYVFPTTVYITVASWPFITPPKIFFPYYPEATVFMARCNSRICWERSRVRLVVENDILNRCLEISH